MGTNYQTTLLKYVERENLPEYLGGTSKATLLDDVGPWKQQNLIDEIDADFKAAVSGTAATDANSAGTRGAHRQSYKQRVLCNASDKPLGSGS